MFDPFFGKIKGTGLIPVWKTRSSDQMFGRFQARKGVETSIPGGPVPVFCGQEGVRRQISVELRHRERSTFQGDIMRRLGPLFKIGTVLAGTGAVSGCFC